MCLRSTSQMVPMLCAFTKCNTYLPRIEPVPREACGAHMNYLIKVVSRVRVEAYIDFHTISNIFGISK